MLSNIPLCQRSFSITRLDYIIGELEGLSPAAASQNIPFKMELEFVTSMVMLLSSGGDIFKAKAVDILYQFARVDKQLILRHEDELFDPILTTLAESVASPNQYMTNSKLFCLVGVLDKKDAFSCKEEDVKRDHLTTNEIKELARKTASEYLDYAIKNTRINGMGKLKATKKEPAEKASNNWDASPNTEETKKTAKKAKPPAVRAEKTTAASMKSTGSDELGVCEEDDGGLLKGDAGARSSTGDVTGTRTRFQQRDETLGPSPSPQTVKVEVVDGRTPTNTKKRDAILKPAAQDKPEKAKTPTATKPPKLPDFIEDFSQSYLASIVAIEEW